MNGDLDTYNTSDPNMSAEQFQSVLQKNLSLKAYPCLYCDATIGNCADLDERLNNLFKHQQQFIDSTIQKIKIYNWDGYTVDFEPDDLVDSNRLTEFVIDWGCQLREIGRQLYVWIGGPTDYNMSVLPNSECIKMITMDTYTANYNAFINIASETMISVPNTSRLGFGLLTSDSKILLDMYMNSIVDHQKTPEFIMTDDVTMDMITSWVDIAKVDQLSIWASIIPPSWYRSLYNYMNFV